MTNIETSKPIGVFDSGIGGLTVLREIKNICPNESVVYVGDEKHFPYGEKTTRQIIEYSLEVCDLLISKDVKMIVVACNTITAAALDKIRNYVKVPVVGVIDSGVNAVVEATKNNKVGILATNATIKSKMYENKLLEINKNLQITSVGAPKLVDFVENDIDMVLNSPSKSLKDSIIEYCRPFKENYCDTVIMACTHFPPLRSLLEEELGPVVSLVSPSQKTAEEVANVLQNKLLISQNKPQYDMISTGPSNFRIENFWKYLK